MRPIQRVVAVAGAVVCVLSLATACNSDGNGGGGGGGGSYHVGMTLDLSAALSDTGQRQRAGATAYINDLNKHGGINGHKVELAVLDDAADTARGTANAVRLVTQDKVSAIFGFTLSNVCAAAAPIAKQRKTPLVCQSLPDDLLYPAKDYLFSAAVAVSAQAKPIIAAAKQSNPDIHKVAFISLDTAATTSLTVELKKLAKAEGWTTVADQSVALDASDVGTQAAKIAASKPDAVFSVLKNSLEIPLVRSLQSGGLTDATIMGYTAVDYDTLAALKTDKLVTVNGLSSGGTKGSGFQKYARIVKAAGAEPLQGFVAAGYAQAEIIAEALKVCGFPCSGEKMNAALNKLSFSDDGFSASKVYYKPNSHQAVHAMYAYRWDTTKNAMSLLGNPVSTGH